MRLAVASIMLLRQFFEPYLAQFSFLAGCSATGRAVVIDPVRRIDRYLQAAQAEGLQIVAVAETHLPADFVSGAAALARRTGATLYVSGEGAPGWQYACAGRPRVQTLHHGDLFHVGRLRVDAVHTPGHAPEHLTFLVADETVSPAPFGAFTGDFLFAGDVGRPDLAETADGSGGSAAAAARQLWHSLRAFAELPDRLLVWPGHGAGAACGTSLGGTPATTLGYERMTNWAFQAGDEEAFVAAVLGGAPDPPRYFAGLKRLNQVGAPPLRATTRLRQLGLADLDALVMVHAEFIDLRPDATTAGFLPGSLALPLTRQFLTWAGSILRYGMPVYIVSADHHEAAAAAGALGLIGIDEVRAWIPESTMREYHRLGGVLERLVGVEPEAARERIESGYVLLDVRTTGEWNAGHIDGAVHAPLARLIDCVRDLDRDTPLLVSCQAGSRALVGATALRRIGFTRVATLAGGYAALERLAHAAGATAGGPAGR